MTDAGHEYVAEAFEAGFNEGVQKAELSRERMTLLAKLLVKNINCTSKETKSELMTLITALNTADDDSQIRNQDRQRIAAILA